MSNVAAVEVRCRKKGRKVGRREGTQEGTRGFLWYPLVETGVSGVSACFVKEKAPAERRMPLGDPESQLKRITA